jgi:hypothetical protein
VESTVGSLLLLQLMSSVAVALIVVSVLTIIHTVSLNLFFFVFIIASSFLFVILPHSNQIYRVRWGLEAILLV